MDNHEDDESGNLLDVYAETLIGNKLPIRRFSVSLIGNKVGARYLIGRSRNGSRGCIEWMQVNCKASQIIR